MFVWVIKEKEFTEISLHLKKVFTMADVINIQSIGYIHFLEDEVLLNCRLVCKSWTSVLNEPMFWLKKLKLIGHSEIAHGKWLDLIQKSIEVGKPKQIEYCFALCLRKWLS